MKKMILISTLLLTGIAIGGYYYSTTNEMATCTGSKGCNACKNCKYCKHCSKNGGSCGVCK